jgi:fructose-bisphosphate aldolase, class I
MQAVESPLNEGVDIVIHGQLEQTAAALLARGKGILAADETLRTLTRRFTAFEIECSPSMRRDYREMLLSAPGASEFISGVILGDEAIRQQSAGGEPLAALCAERGMLPGIRVDAGPKPMAGFDGERLTEGLDGLRERLAEYRKLGARFAEWRAVFGVNDEQPSWGCICANAHALSRYAALCQEQGIVPIVEPEVLANGEHTLERSEEVTSGVLYAVVAALHEQGVHLEGLLLKPSMVLSGASCSLQASVSVVAAATLRCLRRHVPAAVPGVVFLSSGQDGVTATRHLDAMNRAAGARPWTLSFSYGRALQEAALVAWRGKPENSAEAQRAFVHRAWCNGLASVGAYSAAEDPEHAGSHARVAADELDGD